MKTGGDFMYVGRIVAVGNTLENKLVALYRVSSRSTSKSFPNRQSIQIGETIAIVPKEGFEKDIFRNPYITYNCLRFSKRYAVVSNGTQTDPIFEKLIDGMKVRDALTCVLHGMDFEHDHLKTPRIAGVIDLETRSGTLGIIRSDAILIRPFKLSAGEAFYLATYEHNCPDERFKDTGFNVKSADEGCDYILGKGVFANLELPVSAACAIETGTGFEIAHKDY
jgi:IMP cyclohydrolase